MAEEARRETELEFLEDMNALISQTLETKGSDLWQALRTLANEVRSRIDLLEEGSGTSE